MSGPPLASCGLSLVAVATVRGFQRRRRRDRLRSALSAAAVSVVDVAGGLLFRCPHITQAHTVQSSNRFSKTGAAPRARFLRPK
jgi:hypothetical protein